MLTTLITFLIKFCQYMYFLQNFKIKKVKAKKYLHVIKLKNFVFQRLKIFCDLN